jgi:hypothetical protein
MITPFNIYPVVAMLGFICPDDGKIIITIRLMQTLCPIVSFFCHFVQNQVFIILLFHSAQGLKINVYRQGNTGHSTEDREKR